MHVGFSACRGQIIRVLPLQQVSDASEINSLDLFALLSHAALPSLFGCLRARLGIQYVIPPPEATRIIADKALVVNIMVLSAGPEGQEVVQAPGELIATVRINCLEQAEDDPNVHGQYVKISSNRTPEDWRANGTQPQYHNLDR